MNLIYLIGIFIALITAMSIIAKNEKVNSFLNEHQWIYVFLAVCFIGLAIASAYYTDQDEKAKSMAGTLVPTSSNSFDTNDVNPQIEIGCSGTILKSADPAGGALFSVFNVRDLIISRENGQSKISIKIIDRDGAIAVIEDNNWKVNPNNSFDRNYNKSALEVKDIYGDIILQINVLNDRIQLQGKFYDEKGNGIAFFESPYGNGALIEKTTNYSKFNQKINPIFKYPSDKFFGVSA